MLEDWRFEKSPYVETGGLLAYAGAPLRLQNESGECVALGSLCVASSSIQEPLTKTQQRTLAHLADWVVSDMVQCARARRQRERHRMTELLSKLQGQIDSAENEEPVYKILRIIYPDTTITIRPAKATHLEIESHGAIPMCDFEDGLWEDTDYLDDFIANSNHLDFPQDRVVRVITGQCEGVSGPSILAVASRDFRLVFDDIDLWFVQTCAGMVSQMWHKKLLHEVMKAKETFLRGVSHQLRTPIHGILGSVELLAEELKSRKALLEAASIATAVGPSIYLDTIKTSGQDLISIVNSMITLNRWADIAMSERSYETQTIYQLEAELAQEMSKLMSGDPRYRASVFFRNNVPSDFDSVRIDHGLLRDSLLPLITNAIQNTPRGTVTVTTTLRADSRELIVDIEDTGRGIHPDDQQRIFEPHEQVGVHSTGAGLGLTLASKFATLLHGSVTLVSSNLDRGSHFRTTFSEIEYSSSPLPLQPIIQVLEHLPKKFCSMPPKSAADISLCHHFAKFLEFYGFVPSKTLEDDCFVIVNFIPEEERQIHLSQVHFGQVAICLVPTSNGEASFEQTSKNVVYVNGPFFTTTMRSAILEADGLLSTIKAAQSHPSEASELLLASVSVMDSKAQDLEARPASPPAHDSVKLDTEASLTLANLSTSIEQVEPRVVAPNFVTIRSHPKPTALLVDDNLVNLRIMQMYCQKRGLPCVSATDGKQAIDLFVRHQSSASTGGETAIQLIFMDLQMPVCDGIEATRQIRRLEKENQWGQSTLFIVTGQDDPTDRISAESVGADEYYVKPVGMKVLDRGVKQYFTAFTTT